MLDSDTQSRLFQQYPMLREMPAADQAELLATASVMHLPAGTVVFDEDQSCQGFPLLLSGNIHVIKAAAEWARIAVVSRDPGESCILTSSCLLGNTHNTRARHRETGPELVVLPPAPSGPCSANRNRFAIICFTCFPTGSPT